MECDVYFSADLKAKITDALINMKKKITWCKKLQSYNISEFVPVDTSLYDIEKELADAVHGMSLSTTYY